MTITKDIKLVMTLLVRDEEDIIRENIEYHLSQGIDLIILTDNLSEDSTPQILEEYIKKGVLHYILETRDDYNQHEWVTRMARLAYTEYGADWVINNDADEFWWSNSGSLKEYFRSISDKISIVECKRSNFVPFTYFGDFYEQMIYKESFSLNFLGKPLPPKVAHRGDPNVIVHQGNHKVSNITNPALVQGEIEIFHFPIRTQNQFLNKINKGGAARKRNKKLKKSISITWTKLYKKYQKDDLLTDFFKKNFYDQFRIESEILSGKIVKDTRLKEYLMKLFKK